jgi:hypothetical protein
MAMDYCYVHRNLDWENPPAIVEECGRLSPRPSQSEVDDWIFEVDARWFGRNEVRESAQASNLAERFRKLAQQWGDETGHLSSPNQKMLHPSYQAILGMGQEHREEIIDLLLRDLKENRRPWFWALSYLAQTNPITPADAGRMDRMIDAWVRWGQTRKNT